MPPNPTNPVAVSQMSPRRLPDDSQTSPRRLPDDSQTTPRRLPNHSQTTPRRLPDVSQTSPRRLQDVWETSGRRLPSIQYSVLCNDPVARGEQSVWDMTNHTSRLPKLLRPPHIRIILYPFHQLFIIKFIFIFHLVPFCN